MIKQVQKLLKNELKNELKNKLKEIKSKISELSEEKSVEKDDIYIVTVKKVEAETIIKFDSSVELFLLINELLYFINVTKNASLCLCIFIIKIKNILILMHLIVYMSIQKTFFITII